MTSIEDAVPYDIAATLFFKAPNPKVSQLLSLPEAYKINPSGIPVNIDASFVIFPIACPSGTIFGNNLFGIENICPFKCLSLLYHLRFLKSKG